MELIKNIVEYLSIIVSAVILTDVTNTILKYYQQSHYHLSSFKKIIRYYYLGKWQNLIFIIIPFIFFLDIFIVQVIYIIYLVTLLILKSRIKGIIKLKYTARIYRNFFFVLVFAVIFASSLLFLFELPELMSSLAITIFLAPFVVFVGSLISYPIEIGISKMYQIRANRKLKRFKPKVIGITGSFGKTSTKNIIYDFLKEKYITLATKKSYNTLNGLSISINNDLTKVHQVFIAEMGASRKKDIEKLVKLCPPKYGVVTGVTSQHLETFHTIENILNEKMKLIDKLPSTGIGIINGDDELIKKYKIKTKAKIIRYGLNKNCDCYASNIKIDINNMSFDINYKNKSVRVSTKLLGRHNILNILASFALATELKVETKDIVYQISVLEPTKHRLSVEQQGAFTFIDDAFNSNNIGFKNAIEVLSYYPDPRILITPGVVEAGSMEEEINTSFAKNIKDVCDLVILIKTKASMFIKKGLEENNYTNIIVVDSFNEAKKYVFDKYQKASILIENDISDIYKI